MGVDEKTYKETRQALVEKAEFYRSMATETSRAIKGLDAVWLQITRPAVLSPPVHKVVEISADYDKTTPFKPLWSHKAIIIEVAKRMRGNFGVNEVKAAIDEIPKYEKFAPLIQKATISSRLKKMTGPQGCLEIIERGTGTRPTIYRIKRNKTEGASQTQ